MHSFSTGEASIDAEAAFWRDFGFDVACTDHRLTTTLPTGVVAFSPATEDDEQTLWRFTKDLGPPSNMYVSTDTSALSLFRVAADTDLAVIRAALACGQAGGRVGASDSAQDQNDIQSFIRARCPLGCAGV